LGGLGSEFWVPCDSVGPQLGVGRAVDTALVPDIEGIQNKVICLWIGTSCSVYVASTCCADLYDISRHKPSRGAPV